MNELENTNDPALDTPLGLTLTPGGLIHSLFGTANAVHTGWSSCVDATLVLSDLTTLDDRTGNYCRLVEQEFVEDGQEDVVWHDWSVELRLGEVFITGHWQIQVNSPPMDWEWCAQEAETAFDKGCILFGRRTKRSLSIDEADVQAAPPPKPRTH